MAVKSAFCPLRRPENLGSLMTVTSYPLFHYGEQLASEANNPPRPWSPVEKPFLAVTDFRLTCYILAQQTADSDLFWQVYALFERESVTAVPNSPRGRARRKEPKRVQRSHPEGSEPRVIRHRPYCPDGRAEAGLATLALAVLTVTGRDGFSGSAGVGTPPKPVAADTTDKR
jgi:hypothetical protein